MAITKVRASGINLSGNTSYLNMPKGTTAQRPSSPVAGMIRENTTLNKIEVYNGTEWRALKENVPAVEYLVLAGGGGGTWGEQRSGLEKVVAVKLTGTNPQPMDDDTWDDKVSALSSG